MKLFKQLGYIFPTKQRWQFAGLFFLMLIETLLDFAGVSLILPFVNILVNADSMGGAWWYQLIVRITGAKDIKQVLLFITLLMIAIYIIKNAYILFLTNLRVHFLTKRQIAMGTKMLTCYMHKPYTFHLQKNTAEIVRNVNSDVGGAFSAISNVFLLVSDILIIAMLVAYLFAVDVMLTVSIIMALGFCSALYFLLVRKKIRKAGQQNRESAAKMIQAVQQSMGGIKEVKVMGREAYFADVYRREGTKYGEQRRKYAMIAAIPGRLIETLCMGSVLGVIAWKIASGADLLEVVPSLSAFAVAAMRLLPKANSINACISNITYTLPSLDSLYTDLTESDRIELERARMVEEKKRKAKPQTAGKKNIVIRNLSYAYPNMDKQVLHDVNMTIEEGSSVGIVGVTGAGKTTLVDLILGVLEPGSGTICYGNLDIHQDYARWQKHIGYIPQNIYLIDDSIRKNVALGVDEEDIDEAAVWRALENAQLAQFVRGLKDGLDTVIGERGVRISGGQRQRIGIARALYYDPEILFFDEATSSLDNETEAAVMDAVNTIGNSKTMIIVAHRLTTISNCDKVYNVENAGVHETKRP